MNLKNKDQYKVFVKKTNCIKKKIPNSTFGTETVSGFLKFVWFLAMYPYEEEKKSAYVLWAEQRSLTAQEVTGPWTWMGEVTSLFVQIPYWLFSMYFYCKCRQWTTIKLRESVTLSTIEIMDTFIVYYSYCRFPEILFIFITTSKLVIIFCYILLFNVLIKDISCNFFILITVFKCNWFLL